MFLCHGRDNHRKLDFSRVCRKIGLTSSHSAPAVKSPTSTVETPKRFATIAVESTKTSADLSRRIKDRTKVMTLRAPLAGGERLGWSMRGSMGNEFIESLEHFGQTGKGKHPAELNIAETDLRRLGRSTGSNSWAAVGI
jgi:hypothetical protein